MRRPTFDKILIANRGEIAIRIAKTIRKMGLKSVGVYSEADANAMHLDHVDEAIFIGNAPATDSYLRSDRLLAAIQTSGAQAIHPGYGFLSENSEFVASIEKAGIVFIGPNSKCVAAMGDKVEAKRLASLALVNTVPGYLGTIDTPEEAIRIAEGIGFPVMIKAAAGGGGRGMRLVNDSHELEEAFIAASNEAQNNFRDARVFVEKYIVEPRHIEIQVLADKHGNVICLGERECSIQRHHQKLIEEAPSPFLSEAVRLEMYEQVRKLVKNIGYFSAGTVEFIVDPNQNFYFMEMNTRLQVEHCVTELIYGVDIVEQMIRIARDERLTISQADVVANGWAIESRICAEDPTRGFLPSSGRIVRYQEPPKSANIRVDSGVTEGGEVSMFYDQMISKLCTHAPTRLEAIQIMSQALGEYVIKGISHNISFLQAVMGHPRFIAGEISTNFIAQEYPKGFLGAEITSESAGTFLSAAIYIHMTDSLRNAQISHSSSDQPRRVGTRWVVEIEKAFYPVIVQAVPGGYKIRHESNRLVIKSNWTIGESLLRGELNGAPITVSVSAITNGYLLTYAGNKAKVYVLSPRIAELSQFMKDSSAKPPPKQLRAPLTGKVSRVFVESGAEAKLDQRLVVIEAMKMDNFISSTQDGTVKAVHVQVGQDVVTGQLLVEFE